MRRSTVRPGGEIISSGLKIALAHDWLVGMRGGEWVLHRLALRYGPTDLYTLVRGAQPSTAAIDACRIIPSILQRFPGGAGSLRRYYLPLMPWAVEKLVVKDCDLLISSSSCVVKSMIPPKGVPHISYCHSPARYIWDQVEQYEIGSGAILRSLGLRTIRKRFQRWDRRTADRVTTFLANSRYTAERIQRFYGREAQVVYPPVRTEFFTPHPQIEREDWFLVVTALEPYKQTEMVIRTAIAGNFKVKIVGTGSQSRRLRKIAPPHVEMLGELSGEVLLDLYRRARGFLFPQKEDFGIACVEAQATGCPVIAYAEGGAAETVTSKTGVSFRDQSEVSLLAALEEFKARQFNSNQIREHAEQFSEKRFDREMDAVIDRYRKP